MAANERQQAAAPDRPPRLYKRTHLRSKKKAAAGDALFRADRVLANRTGKSRKECFQLLQERRVFQVVEDDDDEHSDTDASNDSDATTSGKKTALPCRLQVVAGPAVKLSMATALRIDKYETVPLPPPLLAVYHKPKVRMIVRYK